MKLLLENTEFLIKKVFGSNLFLVIPFCYLFLHFYSQSLNQGSDFSLHIHFLSIESDSNVNIPYSLLHHLIILITYCLKYLFNLSLYDLNRLLMSLICSVSVIASYIIVYRYFKEKYHERSPLFICLIAISVFIVSMLIIPGSDLPYCLGVGTPNAWHNPTFLICRPFSILVFIYSVEYISNCTRKSFNNIRFLYVILVAAIFSVWSKPSFLISFIPSIGIVLLSILFIKKISFKQVLSLGVVFIPSILFIIVLNKIIYLNSASTNSIVISFASVWQKYTESIPISILLGMAFPLFVLFCNRNNLSLYFKVAFVNYLISTLVFLFLAESGDRFSHGNFGWTYLFGMFFMYLFSIETFFFYHNKSFPYRIIGFSLFFYSFLSGFFYFFKIGNGLLW